MICKICDNPLFGHLTDLRKPFFVFLYFPPEISDVKCNHGPRSVGDVVFHKNPLMPSLQSKKHINGKI